MGDRRSPKARRKFVSADDVPPVEPATAVKHNKPSLPKRQFYYEMYQQYDPLPFNLKTKMATPVDNFPQAGMGRQPKKASATPIGISSDGKKSKPHCKACTDFKTWMELTANPRRNMPKTEREEKQCPLDSDSLGNNTWSFLHTMAAYYPEKPSFEQQHNMRSFITLLSQFYPCHICAAHLREDLKVNPPDTGNNRKLSYWFCEMHNRVNERLGKPIFDCSKVIERWRDGWADNSCD